MTAAELPLLETVRKSSPAAKAAILAELIREQMTVRTNGNHFSIEDVTGIRLGAFVPAAGVFEDQAIDPPPLTGEEIAELQRLVDTRHDALSLEEMLASLDLEDPLPIAK